MFTWLKSPSRTQTNEPPNRARILHQHFFRRFFDNDTLPIPGDPETAVVRALSFCAVPALMFAFWLLPQYPGRRVWSVEADRYFFVLFSFVTMGVVATCEWEMLFPDRADFLILLTLPLKAGELLRAKARAVLTLIGLFLAAANIFGIVLFSAVSTGKHANYLHTAWAHFAAVTLSGIFGAFTMLAIEGLVLCLLPSGWFRTISTLVQSLSITVLLLLFLLYPLIAGHLQALMEGRAAFAIFVPPLWFLGLYETLAKGAAAPAAAWPLALTGLYATAAAVFLALITYPLAWARQKKRALEGASQARVQNGAKLATILHQTILKRPQQRAIFHFIGQTISRNPRYQVFLALCAGAGLAIALCNIVTLRQSASHDLTPALSTIGLHAMLPLLLFWLLAGLRSSFAFPVDLLARWVFPMNLHLVQPISQIEPNLIAFPGPFPGPDAKAAKTWTFLCSLVLTCVVLAILLALGWTARELLVQAVCAIGLAILLADLFFLGRTQIPFTRLRISGLALAFFLYVVFFPTAIALAVHFELTAETRLKLLVWVVLVIPALHLILRKTDHLAQQGIIGGFPEDETDPGPITLGLTQ
jgi:hypothetical protein